MADLTIPGAEHRAAAVGVPPGPASPIITVCGSVTRYGAAIDELVALLTLDGYVVLQTVSIGRKATARERKVLREVHLRKIAVSGMVLVANFDGYVGRDTEFEVLHALKLGKAVRHLLPHRILGRALHRPGVCRDTWQPRHDAGSRPDQCGTCSDDAFAAKTSTCLACPPGCPTCSKDESDCECYEHQGDHPDETPADVCPTCSSRTRSGPISGRLAVDKGDGAEWCDDGWHDGP